MTHCPLKVGDLVQYYSESLNAYRYGVVYRITHEYGQFRVWSCYCKTEKEALEWAKTYNQPGFDTYSLMYMSSTSLRFKSKTFLSKCAAKENYAEENLKQQIENIIFEMGYEKEH